MLKYIVNIVNFLWLVYMVFCTSIISYVIGLMVINDADVVVEQNSASCVCEDCQCGPDGFCGCQFCEHGGTK